MERQLRRAWDRIDQAMIGGFMSAYGIRLLRIALAVTFIWFGALKIAGVSPVADLVAATVYWVNPKVFVPFLGWWEAAVGLGLLIGVAPRLVLLLFWLQIRESFPVEAEGRTYVPRRRRTCSYSSGEISPRPSRNCSAAKASGVRRPRSKITTTRTAARMSPQNRMN
ncbi:MAG: DoxX family protein [Armatimonadetes bacterium]|nr:DoxX family protein [Armatimonadota bacterium]